MPQPTPRFEDLVARIVRRIRRSPAGGFVPHRVPHRPPTSTTEPRRPRCEAGRGLTSYRDVYGCPSSAWGAEDGWTPPVTSDAAAAMQRSAPYSASHGATAACASGRTGTTSATMPFRLFEP